MAEAEFDPRRTEPGQEFGYTGSEEKTIGIDDDVDEGWTLRSVTATTDDEPGSKVIGRDGVQMTMKADSDGVLHPKTLVEAQIADSFGLPVARKAIAEAKKADAVEAPKNEAAKE